ncbi:MAG: nucleotidyltransferase domain-containing protein [Candidatus Bathyarchaeota archaeon]
MRLDEGVEVVYSPKRFELLRGLRRRSLDIMVSLASRELVSSMHGSVARGDVNPGSDIDIIIPYVVSSHTVELALSLQGFRSYSRRIAQATPSHAPKAHIYLDAEEKECVTFPLISLRTLELEFYGFGGILDLPLLKADKRVPGCDKRLMLIQPTELGHIEFSVKGREMEAAKIIGVSLEIVNERVRVLTRRKEVGRTGIVLSVDVDEGEVFEDVFRRLASSNPIVKRIIRARS